MREQLHHEDDLARALTWAVRERIPQWMTNVWNHAHYRWRHDVIAAACGFQVKRNSPAGHLAAPKELQQQYVGWLGAGRVEAYLEIARLQQGLRSPGVRWPATPAEALIREARVAPDDALGMPGERVAPAAAIRRSAPIFRMRVALSLAAALLIAVGASWFILTSADRSETTSATTEGEKALSAPSDRQITLLPLLIAAFQLGARSTSNRKASPRMCIARTHGSHMGGAMRPFSTMSTETMREESEITVRHGKATMCTCIIGAETCATGFQNGPFVALDVETGKIAWQYSAPQPLIGGALATAGNLVFMGEGNGWFEAVNAKTGELLWRYNPGAGVNAPPITYRVNAEQFVAVAAGGNFQLSYPYGDKVAIFKLGRIGQ